MWVFFTDLHKNALTHTDVSKPWQVIYQYKAYYIQKQTELLLLAAKAVNIFYGEKLEISFCVNYLCSNELIGYVDVLNFGKTLPACWSDIDAKKRVKLLQ